MKRSVIHIGVLLLPLSGSAGCKKSAPSNPSSGGAGAVAAADDGGEARRLALSPVRESRPVDALIAGLQEGARRDPGRIDPWISLGQAWVRKAREGAEPGYYKNADACAALALKLDPRSPKAQNLRGIVLLSERRFAEAQQLAEDTLRTSEFDVVALGTLSDALLEQGRIERAEEVVQRMLALKPNLAAYSRASYLAFLRGDGEAAKQALRLAIDAASSSRADAEPRTFAIVQAANLLFLEGDYGGADAGYKLALGGLPEYPPALVGRAQVALTESRFRDAAQLLELAYDRSPLAETAWLLGEARRLLGDAAGAGRAFERLLQSGRHTDPRTVALYLATAGRELADAEALITQELRSRSDVYTQDVYAFVLLRRGRLAEARVAIDAVLKVGLKDPRVLYHAALIHAATGDRAGARALVEDALRRSPRFDVSAAPEARSLLASLSAAGPASP